MFYLFGNQEEARAQFRDQVKKLWGNIKYGYLHFKIK